MNLPELNSIGSCMIQQPWQPYAPFQPQYPLLPWTDTKATIQVMNEPNYQIKIRKVQNGFVLLKDGKEYVFESYHTMVAFLEKELTLVGV